MKFVVMVGDAKSIPYMGTSLSLAEKAARQASGVGEDADLYVLKETYETTVQRSVRIIKQGERLEKR